MEYSARQIAALIGGEVIGNPDVTVNNLSRIEEGKPNTLTFLANPKYEEHIYNTGASVVIVNKTFKAERNVPSTLIKVDDAYMAFAQLLNAYNEKNKTKSGISDLAYIAPSANVHPNAYVGAFVYVGEQAIIDEGCQIFPGAYIGDEVQIGRETIIHSGVRIYEKCKIGTDCIIHANAVIGGDGFGFAPQTKGYQKVSQIGNVVIEDLVEIGAGTTIDAATLGSTIIRKGVKLDNLVQIAHNVEIGEDTVIAAQTGVAGSTKIGKRCMIGGQVGIIGHLTIADDTMIAAQSGIGKSITKPGTIVQGAPAFDVKEYRKSYVAFKNLPEILKKIANLEAEIDQLKKAKEA